MPFYHVRILRKSEFFYLVKLDLDEDQVRKQVVQPYDKGEPIVLAGTIIQLDDIKRIKISRTSEDSSRLLQIIREERAKDKFGFPLIPAESDIVDKGVDVTDDFIKAPPGSKRVVSASLAPRTALFQPLREVTIICDRFHLVAKQLLSRHDKRSTLIINDEHDVQDLLHSLLILFFDDVRPEEHTPSYAGGSSRMDFLLKQEAIVVETKYNLTNKQLADQLAVDYARYRTHPDCKTLICFVYDPNGRIENPRGLEADLNKLSTKGLIVVAYVRP
jgi:hypothetical protein